jgi:hypothetical protein
MVPYPAKDRKRPGTVMSRAADAFMGVIVAGGSGGAKRTGTDLVDAVDVVDVVDAEDEVDDWLSLISMTMG